MHEPTTNPNAAETVRLKQALLRACRLRLEARAARMQANIDAEQQEANSHVGAMVSRYDTFKEEAQMRRDGFAVELEKTRRLLDALRSLPAVPHEWVRAGSVVEAVDVHSGVRHRFFVFPAFSHEPVEVDGLAYVLLSLQAPLGRAFAGRRAGERVSFRGRTYRVDAVR